MLKIAVTMDFTDAKGCFLKPDVFAAFGKYGVEIAPLSYEESAISKIASEMDGLVIPGGVGDIDPHLYGEQVRYESVNVCKSRADFEFRLLEKFLKTEKPLLFICWGMQLLNVYMGGSLYQDIKEDCPHAHCEHVQEEEGHIPTHEVRFHKSSKLALPPRMPVNSTHHQAVKDLAPALEEQARSEDDLIEAATIRGYPSFAWAVQWHPERLKDDPFIPAFLKACRRSG